MRRLALGRVGDRLLRYHTAGALGRTLCGEGRLRLSVFRGWGDEFPFSPGILSADAAAAARRVLGVQVLPSI